MSNTRITPNKKQKYVLVRAVKDSQQRVLLWGNPDIQWHNDIVEELVTDGYEVLEVLGGGWLLLDETTGKSYVWGKSDRFGVAPFTLVRELLGSEAVEEEAR
jgi:hypothetical protein